MHDYYNYYIPGQLVQGVRINSLSVAVLCDVVKPAATASSSMYCSYEESELLLKWILHLYKILALY